MTVYVCIRRNPGFCRTVHRKTAAGRQPADRWGDGTVKRNLLLLWIRDALTAGATALTSVSVLSAFFLHGGLSDEEIGFYLALTPFVNFAVSLLFSGITGRVRKTVSACSVTGFLCAASALGFLLFCRGDVPHGVFYTGALAVGCLLSVFTALKNIFDYKLPCEVMELTDYSLYVSVQGIVSGVSGIVCGALLARLYAVLEFYPVTAGVFLCAGLFFTAASVLNSRLRVLYPAGVGNGSAAEPSETSGNEKKPSGNRSAIRMLFTDRDFLLLIIPNFVRGFGAGAVSLVPVVAASVCAMGESELALITVCTYIGTLVSCLLYAGMAKRFGAPLTGMIGGVGFCLLIPCFAGGNLLFFVLYTLAYVGYNIMCCAVPESVYHYVSAEKVSAFHTWRLALTTLGTTLSTAVFGKVLDRVPPFVLMAVGALSVVVCTAGYLLLYRGRAKLIGEPEKNGN